MAQQIFDFAAMTLIRLKEISFKRAALLMIAIELLVVKPVGPILSIAVLVFWLVNNNRRKRE